MKDRFVGGSKLGIDENEATLRPKTLDEYVGQEKLKHNLRIFIEACKQRGDALDHVLLYGPPGLGKTTLAQIIANELGVSFHITSGPAIERVGDLASIMSNVSENQVMFVDEIHRLNRTVEEVLYPVMEDYAIDIVIGKGPGARTMRLNLNKFTLIGATTRAGLLTGPLRVRFGVILRLELYTPEELGKIVTRSARILNIEITKDASEEIARRSRGTPRIANRLLKRVRDFATVFNSNIVDLASAKKSLNLLEIDDLGLDYTDRRMLQTMIEKFGGGPVGVDTVAAAIGEESVTIEDVIEPYMLQLGFISRTPRGRVVLPGAYKHLGIEIPPSKSEQFSFFNLDGIKEGDTVDFGDAATVIADDDKND